MSQAGAPSLCRVDRRATRLEHSLGASSIIELLGGDIEQQLAALLHDVGHFAFSHTVDYLLSNSDEDSHESRLTDVLPSCSELRDAVSGRDLDYARILDYVCNPPQWLRQVDKLDYVLRDLSNSYLIEEREIRTILQAIGFDGEYLYFSSASAAFLFCELMQRCVGKLYMSPADLYYHRVLSDAMSSAIDAGAISLADLRHFGDLEIISKIQSNESLFRSFQEQMGRSGDLLKVGGGRMFSKARLYEPLVKLNDREFANLSEYGGRWKQLRSAADSMARIGSELLVSRY